MAFEKLENKIKRINKKLNKEDYLKKLQMK